MFFSIDGGDGTGKSTQIDLFCQWLRGQGYSVVTCRDPGSTPLGEAIRDLLLHRHDVSIGRRSEMLLYMAARAQLVTELIQPASKPVKSSLPIATCWPTWSTRAMAVGSTSKPFGKSAASPPAASCRC